MHKKLSPAKLDTFGQVPPHCDQRILHALGECAYCDARPDWQRIRQMWGIAFTGYESDGKELPCPADYARGNAHTLWGGNVARPAESR